MIFLHFWTIFRLVTLLPLLFRFNTIFLQIKIHRSFSLKNWTIILLPQLSTYIKSKMRERKLPRWYTIKSNLGEKKEKKKKIMKRGIILYYYRKISLAILFMNTLLQMISNIPNKLYIPACTTYLHASLVAWKFSNYSYNSIQCIIIKIYLN